MQLKFDVYFNYDSSMGKYSIYRLLPKPRKISFSISNKEAERIDTFLRELEKGNELSEIELNEMLKDDKIIFTVFRELCELHMVIAPEVEYQDSPYKRQLEMFEAWDDNDIAAETYQNRLLESKVLVIGAGGLGTNIVNQIANIGVGEIYVADYDRIEISNLSRQFLFTKQDIGKYKSFTLAECINKRGLGKVIPINERIDGSNISRIIHDNNIQLVTGITNSAFNERNELIKSILKEEIPVLCASEHYVGPLLLNTEDFDRFVEFQKNKFVLHENYLEKREVQKVTNRHPSMITDLSMVSSICASDIMNYFSGVIPCRLINTVYSLNQVSLNFRLIHIEETSYEKSSLN